MITALRLRLVFSFIVAVLLYGILEYRFTTLLTDFVRTEVIYCIFNIREVVGVIDNIITKLALLLGGRWDMLGSSCVFAGKFTAGVLCFWWVGAVIRWKSKIKARPVLHGAVNLSGLICIFILLRNQFSNSVSGVLIGLTFLIYVFNMVLNEDSRLCVGFVKYGIDGMLLILLFVGETLFFPLYLSRAGLIHHAWVRKLLPLSHGAVLLFGSAVLVTPLTSGTFSELMSLGKYEGYDLRFSKIYSKLFFYSSEDPEMCEQFDFVEHVPQAGNKIESLTVKGGNLSIQTVYQGGQLSQFIELNDKEKEIYFIDRDDSNLVIMDMENLRIKSVIYSEVFGDGDSYLTMGGGFLYVINETPDYLYKIDTKKGQIIKQEPIKSINSGLIFNPHRSVLYSTDFLPTAKDKNGNMTFSLSEIDGETLKVLRRIPLLGLSSIVLSRDGSKLFCLIAGTIKNNWIYVLNVETLQQVDKIPAPFGSRVMVMDEANKLLFLGNALTGLVDIISLESKKVIKTYRAGRYSLRTMVLDEESRSFYVSTQYFGLYKGTY